MPGKPFSSLAEQVAATLREGIRKGQWKGEMPGRNTLAEQLGVNHKTVDASLRALEKDGLLERQGVGRGRKILSGGDAGGQQLRVIMLAYERSDMSTDYHMEIIHRLQAAGNVAEFAAKTMHDLGMNAERIARFVATVEADAWIVIAGSRDVLDWFAQQSVPTFALFGRMMHVDLAGTYPLKMPAYRKFVGRLVALGHRRISMLTRADRRRPTPGLLEQHFLDLLGEHGIMTGSFNLPDWDDTPADFRRCLDSLFGRTPPTALIINEPSLFIAAQQHLALNGILSPRDVSLICGDASPVFGWCYPTIAHIRWDPAPIVRRVVRWADQVSRGIDKRRKTTTKAEFINGGTLGPVSRA